MPMLIFHLKKKPIISRKIYSVLLISYKRINREIINSYSALAQSNLYDVMVISFIYIYQKGESNVYTTIV